METQTKAGVFSGALTILFSVVMMGCGSFQGVSYYQADGIYNRTLPKPQSATVRENNTTLPSEATSPAIQPPSSGIYYQNYFQNLSDEYTSTPASNDVFVDVDGYSSATPHPQPWGSQPNKTEIYILQNRPLSPSFNFAWGWGWNRFDMWRFRQPWMGFNQWGFGADPYWGWAGMSSFYNPYWGGFYSPYPFYNPYRPFSRYRYGNPYYRNNYRNRNRGVYGNQQRYSRVASQRGEKTYPNTPTNRNRNANLEKSERQNSTRSVNSGVRYNIGRNLYSIGYDRIPANLGRVRSSIPTSPNDYYSGNTNGRSSRTPPSAQLNPSSRRSNSFRSGRSNYNQGRLQSRSQTSPSRQNYGTQSRKSYSSPSNSSRSYNSGRSGGSRSSSRNGGRSNN